MKYVYDCVNSCWGHHVLLRSRNCLVDFSTDVLIFFMFQMQSLEIPSSFAVSRTSGRYGELWLDESTLLSVSHEASIHKNTLIQIEVVGIIRFLAHGSGDCDTNCLPGYASLAQSTSG